MNHPQVITMFMGAWDSNRPQLVGYGIVMENIRISLVKYGNRLYEMCKYWISLGFWEISMRTNDNNIWNYGGLIAKTYGICLEFASINME